MYLGIDLGTSSIKTIVIDDAGKKISESSQPIKSSSPRAMWSEQNPIDWLEAAEKTILSIPKKIRTEIKGIGLSGQMHGAVLLDNQDRLIRPAILWNDGRSHQECQELEKNFPELQPIIGNQIMPGFTSPKISWLKKNEKENFSKINKILLPKDYLRFAWCGDYSTDVSDASGTMWLDIKKRSWSERAVAATEISIEQLPKVFESNEITGMISKSTSKKLGIPIIPVVAGAGDQAAGAIGSSVINVDDASLVLGTSGVIFIVTEGFLPNPMQGIHAFCHAMPNTWHQMAVILSAASAIDWCANLTGFDSPKEAYDAAEKKGHSDDVFFLPYLNGERTPHNNPYATSLFQGLKSTTDRAAIIHASMEGVAFALKDGFDALIDAGGKCDTITVIGGGSRSRYWGKIIANCLDKTLIYRDGSDVGPAKGAALLAQCGINKSKIETINEAAPIIEAIEPENNHVQKYSEKINTWRKLYHATKKFN